MTLPLLFTVSVKSLTFADLPGAYPRKLVRCSGTGFVPNVFTFHFYFD